MMYIQKSYKTRARKKFLAWAISMAISALPMMGLAAPTVTNIATPNSDGLSSNTVATFNVTAQGTVLNNSQGATTSQLAGAISGNPNLKNGSAQMILMQVTGTSASTLNGALEVAGKTADLVIANTNGISANGLRLINTGNTYLTTGQPSFYFDYNNGIPALKTVYVPSGDITVGGKGITDTGSSLNLYSRTATVNGKITAQNLNVVLGTNLVDPKNPTNPSTIYVGKAPAKAINVSSLGGMYASNIVLVSTEKGAGVNNAGSITTQGMLTLTSNGYLTNTGTATISGGQTTLRSTGVLTNKGTISGDTMLNIDSGSNIVNDSNSVMSLRNGELLNLSAKGTLTNKGNIQAVEGSLSVKATGSITNDYGQIGAAKRAEITSATGSLTNSNAGQIIGDVLALKAATDITNDNSTISAYNGATLTAGNDINNLNEGQIAAGAGSLALTAGGNINNIGAVGEDGTLYGSVIQAVNGGITATAGGSIVNDNGSMINASGNTVLTAKTGGTGSIINQHGSEILVSNGALTLNATGANQNVTNLDTSSIYAYGSLKANAGGVLLNEGSIDGGNVALYGDTFVNNGSISSANDLFANTPNTLVNSGNMSAGRLVSQSDTIVNTGSMSAKSLLQAYCFGDIANSNLLGTKFAAPIIKVTSGMGSITIDTPWNVDQGNSLSLAAFDNIYVNKNIVGGGFLTTVKLTSDFGKVLIAPDATVTNPDTFNPAGFIVIDPKVQL